MKLKTIIKNNSLKKIIRHVHAFVYRLGANVKGYKIPLLKGYDYDYYYKK